MRPSHGVGAGVAGEGVSSIAGVRGERVGSSVTGEEVGSSVGQGVGASVGEGVFSMTTVDDGSGVGVSVTGALVGSPVTGAFDGLSVGSSVGASVGSTVGLQMSTTLHASSTSNVASQHSLAVA